MLKGMAASSPGRTRPGSASLFYRARNVFPGGTTRATVDKDPHPIYVVKGQGAYVVDCDGNRLLDLNNNFTTLLHGHGFAPVTEAVARLLRTGTCFSNPTRHEIALAELLIERIPAIERIRFVNTGTEAVMFAIKAARAFTGKPAIARFEGAYHGAYDWAEAGQHGSCEDPVTGRRIAKAAYAGAPERSLADIVMLDFNDGAGIEATFSANADRLAAVLIDPMPSRAGLLRPDPYFVSQLATCARRHGILIIADEVLNLRQGFEGASARYGIEPDLLTAGKIIGGGFPIGAVGGRADVMSVFGGDGKASLVFQGGTFSANPVSMVAGLAAMNAMSRDDFERLEQFGDRLRLELTQISRKYGARASIAGAASLFRIHPKTEIPSTYSAAIMTPDEKTWMRQLTTFFNDNGILLPFDAAACLSTPMTEDDLGLIASVYDSFLSNYPFPSKEAQP